MRARSGSLRPADMGRLVLVMLLWAVCFPLIAAGLAWAPPLHFAALRSLVAGVGLLLAAVALRRPLGVSRTLWPGLAGVGLTITGLGFGGMFLAGGLVTPGLATVLANIQPLLAAGLAYFALGERLGPRRRVGLALGFAGVVLVALPGFGGGSVNSSPLGLGFILLGAGGVAVGNVLLKGMAGKVDPLAAMGYQFLLGGGALYLASLVFEGQPQAAWTPGFVTVLLALALPGTALAFALWFALLEKSELNRLNTFTFLTPAFGLLLGAAFFAESLGPLEAVGVALVLAGVVWVSREKPRPSR